MNNDNEYVSSDWIDDCIKYHGVVLKGRNAHWCPDWDDLPIDETCPEFDCCTCKILEEEHNGTTVPS